MMKVHLAAAALALSLVQAAPAIGQTDSNESVAVQGRAEARFVRDISVESGGENQLARWAQRICPSVTGLSAEHGQAVADHIAAHALELGLGADEPGCRPNVLVYVSRNPTSLARDLVNGDGDLFARLDTIDVNTRGRQALDEFINSSQPVRWWHVARTVTASGFEANPVNMRPIQRDSVPVGAASPGGASRLARATRQDFSRAIIIVDANRVARIPVGAVGEYIALVALAQLNPDADTSRYQTILNLFDGSSSRVTSLSAWDRAYLASLYEPSRTRTQDSQERAIVARLQQ